MIVVRGDVQLSFVMAWQGGEDEVEELHVLRLQLRQSAAIAPNRVCCNALLAAYARARVPQWQKVCTELHDWRIR